MTHSPTYVESVKEGKSVKEEKTFGLSLVSDFLQKLYTMILRVDARPK